MVFWRRSSARSSSTSSGSEYSSSTSSTATSSSSDSSSSSSTSSYSSYSSSSSRSSVSLLSSGDGGGEIETVVVVVDQDPFNFGPTPENIGPILENVGISGGESSAMRWDELEREIRGKSPRGGTQGGFVSMNDALSMPFDNLRSIVRDDPGPVPGIRSREPYNPGFQGSASRERLVASPRAPRVPEGREDLTVFVTTRDEAKRKRVDEILRRANGGDAKVRFLESDRARRTLQGKEDFVLFDDLRDALDRGEVVVIACERGDERELRTAQAYLLSSICEWFKQKKVDGAGEEYNELKNFDPITKKIFAKHQILALVDILKETKD